MSSSPLVHSGPSVVPTAPHPSRTSFSKSANAARQIEAPIPVQCQFGGAAFNGYVLNKPGQSVDFGSVGDLLKLEAPITHPSQKTRFCDVFLVKTEDGKTLQLQVGQRAEGPYLVVTDMRTGVRGAHEIPRSANLSLSVGGSLRFSPELRGTSIVSVWGLENRSSQSFFDVAKPGGAFILQGRRLDTGSTAPQPSRAEQTSVFQDAIRRGKPLPFPTTPAEDLVITKIREARRGIAADVPVKVSLSPDESTIYNRLRERASIQEDISKLSHKELREWLSSNRPPTGRSDYDLITTHPDLRSMTSNELCQYLQTNKGERRSALKALEAFHSTFECHGVKAAVGSGWLHWKINDRSPGGETHKVYITTKNQPRDVSPRNMETLLRHLADNGFSGQVKVDGAGQGLLRYDQIVIHARDQRSLELAERFVSQQAYVRDVSRGVDRFGLSYNQYNGLTTELRREGRVRVPMMNFDWERTAQNIHITFPPKENPYIIGILDPDTGNWIGTPAPVQPYGVNVTVQGFTRHPRISTFSREQAERIGEERLRRELNGR
jgi:hypothetical protein